MRTRLRYLRAFENKSLTRRERLQQLSFLIPNFSLLGFLGSHFPFYDPLTPPPLPIISLSLPPIVKASEAVRAATARSDADGQRKAATSTAEAQAKNFDIASLNSDISELTDSLNSLSERKVLGDKKSNLLQDNVSF